MAVTYRLFEYLSIMKRFFKYVIMFVFTHPLKWESTYRQMKRDEERKWW